VREEKSQQTETVLGIPSGGRGEASSGERDGRDLGRAGNACTLVEAKGKGQKREGRCEPALPSANVSSGSPYNLFGVETVEELKKRLGEGGFQEEGKHTSETYRSGTK